MSVLQRSHTPFRHEPSFLSRIQDPPFSTLFGTQRLSLRPAWAGTPAPPPPALALLNAQLQGSGRVPAAGADLRHWTGNAESRPGRATAACASSPRRLKPVSPANRSSGSWTQRGPLLLRGQEVTVISAVARCHWLQAFLFKLGSSMLSFAFIPPLF